MKLQNVSLKSGFTYSRFSCFASYLKKKKTIIKFVTHPKTKTKKVSLQSTREKKKITAPDVRVISSPSILIQVEFLTIVIVMSVSNVSATPWCSSVVQPKQKYPMSIFLWMWKAAGCQKASCDLIQLQLVLGTSAISKSETTSMQGKIYLLHGLQLPYQLRSTSWRKNGHWQLSCYAVRVISRHGGSSDRCVLVDRMKHKVDLPVNLHIQLGERSKMVESSGKLDATWELRPI